MEKIEGLFEIHITVNIINIFQLRMYCLDNHIKPIMAVSAYGSNPYQVMISKFKNGYCNDVIKKATDMVSIMERKYKIEIIRVKVESMMHNIGVPKYKNNKWSSDSYYFEYHLKIHVENSEEWYKLADVVKVKGAHLSFNAFKKETIPLITLRLPGNIGSIEANNKKNELMTHLKENGFSSNDGIQQEFSVYDSCYTLDNEWLT